MKALDNLTQLRDILIHDIGGNKDYHVCRLMTTDTAKMILRRIQPAIDALKKSKPTKQQQADFDARFVLPAVLLSTDDNHEFILTPVCPKCGDNTYVGDLHECKPADGID